MKPATRGVGGPRVADGPDRDRRRSHARLGQAVLRRVGHADAGVHLPRGRPRRCSPATRSTRTPPGIRELRAGDRREDASSCTASTYRPSEIMSTVGATMAIFTAVRALVGPGDNAVVISPTYAIFANAVHHVRRRAARPVPLDREGTTFRLDLDRVRAAIDGQHADAHRQQSVESDRLGDHRRRAARALRARRAARPHHPRRRGLRAAGVRHDARAVLRAVAAPTRIVWSSSTASPRPTT